MAAFTHLRTNGAVQFVFSGAPRTKKNSQRQFMAVSKAGKRYRRVMPSKAYCDWLDLVRAQAFEVMGDLRTKGVTFPITGPVAVKAHFYRQRDCGDLCGFEQALGDALQDIGVIDDDRQIVSWDGTRLLKDARNPRVVVSIEEEFRAA